MNNHKIRVLFVIALNRVKKNNKAPIYCRITYNKKRKQFATGIFIEPSNWNNIKQSIRSKEINYKEYNTQLSLILQNVNQAFLLLQIQKESFDVDDVYLQYKGENIKADKTLLEVFKMHNNRICKLVGVETVKLLIVSSWRLESMFLSS